MRHWLTAMCAAAALALVTASGCETDGLDGTLACERVCECTTAALPSQQRACVTECVADIAGVPVPEVCTECLLEASCPRLVTGVACQQECNF